MVTTLSTIILGIISILVGMILEDQTKLWNKFYNKYINTLIRNH